MTALAFAVPYNRTSPLYLPRRDLVLDAADSLSLAVTVTESDAPGASLIDLHTGPTFPEFTLILWQDSVRFVWDYGGGAMYPHGNMSALAAITGTISAIYPGTVNFAIGAGALSVLPVRCAWAIRMDHDTSLSETLAAGSLHIRGAIGAGTLGGTFTLDDLRGLGVLG